MPAVILRRTRLPDDQIGRHFAHHQQFRDRQPGRSWIFAVVQVPFSELYCLYDDPGVRHETNPAGLMGSVGATPTGYHGARIVEMAARIAAALAANGADPKNQALRWVLELREGGPDFIRSQDQPLALSCLHGVWFVREGTHRAVALALLGAEFLEAIDFESGTLDEST